MPNVESTTTDVLPNTAKTVVTTIPFTNYDEALAVLGPRDAHLRVIEREFDATLLLRGTTLEIHTAADSRRTNSRPGGRTAAHCPARASVERDEVESAAVAVHHRKLDPVASDLHRDAF